MIPLQLFHKSKITTKYQFRAKSQQEYKGTYGVPLLQARTRTRYLFLRDSLEGQSVHWVNPDLDSVMSLSAPQPGDQRKEMPLSPLEYH